MLQGPSKWRCENGGLDFLLVPRGHNGMASSCSGTTRINEKLLVLPSQEVPYGDLDPAFRCRDVLVLKLWKKRAAAAAAALVDSAAAAAAQDAAHN